MDGIRHLFDGKSLSDDMCHANGRIIHVYSDFLTQQLTVAVPGDRILIHRHAGILGVEDQGIAYCLHICTVSPYLRIGMHLTVNGVGIDMEGIDAHGI